MSQSLLDRYGEEYIRNVFETATTVDECCERLNTISKYVGYYAKELGCEKEYAIIKSNKTKLHIQYPEAYMQERRGNTNVMVRNIPVWTKYVIENKLPTQKRQVLLDALVQCGYKEYKCECCGISDWNGKSISLQLHHINGNSRDNSLSNLQILCPNCHSQTDNYGSKNAAKTHK